MNRKIVHYVPHGHWSSWIILRYAEWGWHLLLYSVMCSFSFVCDHVTQLLFNQYHFNLSNLGVMSDGLWQLKINIFLAYKLIIVCHLSFFQAWHIKHVVAWLANHLETILNTFIGIGKHNTGSLYKSKSESPYESSLYFLPLCCHSCTCNVN